jgi:hypothetical protein
MAVIKRKRKKKWSSGAWKTRSYTNVSRRAAVTLDLPTEQYIRHQAEHRWPTEKSEDLYFKMNNSEPPEHKLLVNRIRPPQLEFPLLESLPGATLYKILLASSLRVKKIKRHPGWILERVYNLRDRPIQII